MKLEGGALPFPRFQRERGDVDFLSLFPPSENKKAPRRFPPTTSGNQRRARFSYDDLPELFTCYESKSMSIWAFPPNAN
jgi:hypothetical protein